MRRIVVVVVTALVVHATAAHAADPALKCRAGKLKEAAKYGQCRLSAESKALKAGDAADFSKCTSTVSSKWQKLEDASGGACPSMGDLGAITSVISEHTLKLAALLEATELSVVCGFPETGRTISYGPGDDGAVGAGAPLAYRDNGDGTITDLNTGLMWERKVGGNGPDFGAICFDESGSCANPHHVGNGYNWTSSSSLDRSLYNGPVVSVFLEQLNNRCHADTTVRCSSTEDCARANEFDNRCGFAGYRDWRLPTVKELVSILDLGRTNGTAEDPAVNPVFHSATCGVTCTDVRLSTCSCTKSGGYWSSTTYINDTDPFAMQVSLGDQGETHAFGVIQILKYTAGYARAVRGGL